MPMNSPKVSVPNKTKRGSEGSTTRDTASKDTTSRFSTSDNTDAATPVVPDSSPKKVMKTKPKPMAKSTARTAAAPGPLPKVTRTCHSLIRIFHNLTRNFNPEK